MDSDRFIAPSVEVPRARPDDPRVGGLIGHQLNDGTRVAIIGFPVDEGVVRNGGRAGAARGPDEIRRYFYRLTMGASPDPLFGDLIERTCDLGNLRVDRNLEENQRRLGEAVKELLARDLTVAILGGGHETTYGHFLGYAGARRRVEILNWDAHADVRELREGKGHSGSPFRQALEHPSAMCAGYDVAGLLEHSNNRAHVDFVRQKGGRAIPLGEIDSEAVARIYRGRQSDLLVSFDLDALDQSVAPGVSAPASGGMETQLWLQAIREAARCRRVTSVDFVEVNPAQDRDGQTARLAAVGLWTFLMARARAGAAG
jgi:formiminoglutamase